LLGGGVTPGTLMTDSKLGINFSTLTVGVDLGVQIGGGTYRITTPGGANAGAGDLPLTGVLFASSAQNVGVNVITPSAGILCTTGNCTAAIAGFLAGNGTDIFNQGPNPIGEAPPYVGLNYAFGNSATPQVSGAAAFGRDLPLIQVAAATYIDAGGVDQLA